MLRIETFTFNPFQENTYLMANENKDCWIVDPGMYDNKETEYFFARIHEQGLLPRAIINTHTHIDHIFGVASCKEKFNIPFLIHEKDLPVLKGAKGSAMLFGFSFDVTPQPDDFLVAGSPLFLGDERIDVRFTPGHSPGSVVFYHEAGQWLVGGDVLFQGSIGRTDLPGGHHETLIESIQTELMSLPDDTRVYSGHGPVTTIGSERLHNPFLQDI